MRRILLFACVLLAVFFNSCGDPKKADDSTRRPGETNPIGERSRDGEIRRLTSRNNTPIILTTIEDRYRGVTIYEDYRREYEDDSPCDEYEECKDICARLVSSTRRRRCHQEPHSLIRALEQGVLDILSISNVESVNVTPGLLQTMFEIDRNIISSLIRRDHMSEGDLRSFLAWVALNRDIARILDHEDRSRHILEDAFRNLGEFQTEKTHGSLKTGFNMGLIGSEDTFLALAADRDNAEAFIMGNGIIEKDICSTRQCKLEMYCARDRGRKRSRFERVNTSTECQTPGEVRRYRRDGICYVHGSITWSYLDDLIEEEEIKSSDLSGFIIGVDKCNEVCGDKESVLCDAI